MDVSKRKPQPYGAGSVYRRVSDGRWVGTIEAGYTRTGARRRITVTAKTEAAAKVKLKERKRQIATEGATMGDVRKTVKSWAEEWLSVRATRDRPKTHTTDRGAVGAWIVPTIGHKRLDALTPGDMRAVSNALRQAGKSTSTARRYHGVLIRLLKAARDEGYAVPARVLAVEPPKEAAHDRTALPLTETLAVLEVASRLPHGSRWALAFLQGLRQGEALGLTWAEVGEDSLAVSWQLQALPYVDKRDRSKGFLVPDGYEVRHLSGAHHLVRPKSEAGQRVIPLVPWAAEALAAWREQAPASPHGLVWPGSDGDPRDIRDDTNEWREIQTAAGIAHPCGRPYHGHEIRHSAATLLMALQVPDSVRIAIMGHSSIAVTRGYEHADITEARRALTRAAERLGLTALP
jgi:integrase